VHRCLEKDPEQRFQSASDLAFALEALSESGSSSIASIDQGSRSRWAWPLAAGVVVALAAAIIAWWRIPSAVPVVESITQLTDDGVPKQGDLVSDGARIYFNEGQTKSWKMAQVSVSGGPTAPVATRLVDPQLTALAPDGSALLALPGGMDAPTGALWSIPLPAGEPRRLGDIETDGADFFPDGRIVFSNTKELYIADKDGSNPRKLLSVAAGTYGPVVSPDGRRIIFATLVGGWVALAEVAADGTGLHTIVNASPDKRFGGVAWSSDGKYLVYTTSGSAGWDMWSLPMQAGFSHRTRQPIRLTNGPLSYSSLVASRDGKQVFAIDTKTRGELVHFDIKSHQFLPLLSGISAIDPTFSRDGQWVAYISYPDHTLWRSRSDGTERRQLTYPPMAVVWPSISPDGTKVSFTTSHWEIYVVTMDGGLPQRIGEKLTAGASWSPDGNLLLMGNLVNLPNGAIAGGRAADFRRAHREDIRCAFLPGNGRSYVDLPGRSGSRNARPEAFPDL